MRFSQPWCGLRNGDDLRFSHNAAMSPGEPAAELKTLGAELKKPGRSQAALARAPFPHSPASAGFFVA
jgi:hypothetical protein